MIKKPVTIQANMDMEARPIAHLVQEASQYSSKVYIELDEKKINAKSIMGMMSLKLTKGTNLVVVADGDDESNAIEGVEAFLAVGH
ncbi:HPr family phosphocarrier protein [Lachnospiraceae bacterium MD308]|jgi:catabolite repression HPr-like protein|nr:HPr family phosphocarrier protein [Lachnospiraceae bacterium MD308]MCI8580719.1 HPr family phosphocarrier protein [Dorea sp.]